MVEMLSIYDTDGTLLRCVPVCPESDSGEACIGRENCIMGDECPVMVENSSMGADE